MATQAHAPGSVTVVFAPTDDDGSIGVSFATEDGVVSTVEPADSTEIRLDGEPTSFEPVELALADLGVEAAVDLRAEIPVGAGFGASGAATLSTVLAADEEFELGRSRDGLVEVARRAEVAAGTGLGDVYVQNLGGFAYDTGEGRKSVARDDELRYVSWGGIATGDLLGDDAAMARVREAGTDALSRFDPEMPLPDLFDLSWTFAERTGLVTESVAARVRDVDATGGAATMAMVGETVVGVGDVDGVSDAVGESLLPERTRIDPEGARVL